MHNIRVFVPADDEDEYINFTWTDLTLYIRQRFLGTAIDGIACGFNEGNTKMKEKTLTTWLLFITVT